MARQQRFVLLALQVAEKGLLIFLGWHSWLYSKSSLLRRVLWCPKIAGLQKQLEKPSPYSGEHQCRALGLYRCSKIVCCYCRRLVRRKFWAIAISEMGWICLGSRLALIFGLSSNVYPQSFMRARVYRHAYTSYSQHSTRLFLLPFTLSSMYLFKLSLVFYFLFT